MVRVLGDTWPHWGLYTASSVVRVALLWTIWREYRGMCSGTGEQYGGSIGRRLAVLEYWVILQPLQKSRAAVHAGLYIS